jgi:hypothetical protein
MRDGFEELMSIESRLNKLEKPISGDYCPHQPMRVVYGDDGSGERGQQFPDEAPELETCWCGLEPLLLRVVYGEVAPENAAA